MIEVVLVESANNPLDNLAALLTEAGDTHIKRINAMEEARKALVNQAFDVAVISDNLDGMDGIDFIKEIVKMNPMANCALISDLSEKQFHEATEGLGVLMQIPSNTQEKHVIDLLQQIRRVLQLTAGNER